ncbi:hypothetical protein [Rickettsia endosymbiont of Aspidapion aeneum]
MTREKLVIVKGCCVDIGIVIARRDVVPTWQSNIRHAELVSASL